MISYFLQYVFLLLINNGKCIDTPSRSYLFDNSPPENGISDFILSKGYLPKEKELPKSSVVRKVDNDVTYLLSKLSDDELIRLLNEKPNKNVYDLNDVVEVAFGHNFGKEARTSQHREDLPDPNYKTFRDSGLDNPQTAFYKLEHQAISTNNQNKANYLAMNKLNDLLSTHPKIQGENFNDDNKELLFDILVAQLRTLCCKSTVKKLPHKKEPQTKEQRFNEFMFLIVNDEIKNKSADDDLILVDPDTLEKNSSVLLLGPITSPLTDGQLKVVMKRISNELSKPEYSSLLKQLSDGTVSDSNINLMKNFIFGPETRRYIKAHRCNHQSKLSKVYGGPKWLICTGYLNINTPSLYD